MYTMWRTHLIFFSLSSFSTFVPIFFSLLMYWFNRFDYNKRKAIIFKDNKQMDRSRMKKNKNSSRNKVALANGYDETTISTDINHTQETEAHKHSEAHTQKDTHKKVPQTVFFRSVSFIFNWYLWNTYLFFFLLFLFVRFETYVLSFVCCLRKAVRS